MEEDLFETASKITRISVFDPRAVSVVRQIERESGRTIEVRFNRNRWTYFSCESVPGRHDLVRLSLHECFLDAPSEVIGAVATLIRREDKGARRTIAAFVDAQSRIWDRLADRPPRATRLRTRGRVYDLRTIFDELNARYFDGACAARVTWGKRSRTSRRHITFGSFDEKANLIRVHPVLDRRRVPRYFVRYIVYHEMLHAIVSSPLSPTGRRLYHSRRFRQLERKFDDYDRALRWSRRFLGYRPERDENCSECGL